MLETRRDLRSDWHHFCALPAPTAADVAAVLALPPGARTAPIEWVAEVRREEHVSFDRDAMEEYVYTTTHVGEWRTAPDPRVAYAGQVSLLGVESATSAWLARWPGQCVGPSVVSLVVDNDLLDANSVAALGAGTRWQHLTVFGALWDTEDRVYGGLQALAGTWPALRGLNARLALSQRGLDALLAAPWLRDLDEVMLSMSRLPPGGAEALFAALGEPTTVEVQDLRTDDAVPWHALAPHLTRCRWARLGGNAMSAAELATLLAACGPSIEDLWLHDADLDDTAVEALCAAELPRLRGLWLHGNRLTDRSVQHLRAAGLLERLDGLSLFSNHLSDASTAALAAHPLADAVHQTARRPGVVALQFAGSARSTG